MPPKRSSPQKVNKNVKVSGEESKSAGKILSPTSAFAIIGLSFVNFVLCVTAVALNEATYFKIFDYKLLTVNLLGKLKVNDLLAEAFDATFETCEMAIAAGIVTIIAIITHLSVAIIVFLIRRNPQNKMGPFSIVLIFVGLLLNIACPVLCYSIKDWSVFKGAGDSGNALTLGISGVLTSVAAGLGGVTLMCSIYFWQSLKLHIAYLERVKGMQDKKAQSVESGEKIIADAMGSPLPPLPAAAQNAFLNSQQVQMALQPVAYGQPAAFSPYPMAAQTFNNPHQMMNMNNNPATYDNNFNSNNHNFNNPQMTMNMGHNNNNNNNNNMMYPLPPQNNFAGMPPSPWMTNPNRNDFDEFHDAAFMRNNQHNMGNDFA